MESAVWDTETRLSGEADYVPLATLKSWIKRIPELTKGSVLSDIWNMDELGLFFKVNPDKVLIEKANSRKGSKTSKIRLTPAIFVSADGEMVDDPVVIWRSKKPRCFKKIKNRPKRYPLIFQQKAGMNSEVNFY